MRQTLAVLVSLSFSFAWSASAASPVSPAPMETSIKDIEWGPETGGLRSRIWTDKANFRPEDPIPVHYCIQNSSTSEQTIWHRGFWLDHGIELIGPDGSTIEPKDPQRGRLPPPTTGSDKNVPVVLKPQQIDAAYVVYNLRDLFPLERPGSYKVRYSYRISKNELVYSNWLKFEQSTAPKHEG